MPTFEESPSLSAGISGAAYSVLPHPERRHYMRCDACGLYYDRRSFAEVVYHASGHNATEASQHLGAPPGYPIRPGLRRYHRAHRASVATRARRHSRSPKLAS
jgi:hypothetical protein